jgi:predicted SnoaL-like aldol condensation-catalyzing enzyme
MKKLDLQNLDACRNIFSDNFVWHYFNPELPELEGDYCGIEGLKGLFSKLNEKSNSSFQRNVVDARPAGDELVVVQVRNHLAVEGNAIELDAVVVWRIVNNKIAEAWDIPAVNTVRPLQQ